MSVSRDPSDYEPQDHVYQRVRERNIPWEWIAEAISDGEISHDNYMDNCVWFNHERDSLRTLRVSANTKTCEIVTATWQQQD